MEQRIIPQKGELRVVLTPQWVDAEGVFADARLSWSGTTLSVTWSVKEPQLRRMCTHANDTVWEDSCVEIFLSREKGGEYRNFEFSAAGYALVGRGTSRKGRILYPDETVSSIPIKVTLLENTSKQSVWTLNAEIDLKRFGLADGLSLQGQTLYGNIYCCGDKLDKPHFLSYGTIDTLSPDFHQSQAFVPFSFS